MTQYNLLPNEVILLRDESVLHGKGSSGELILTNHHLVISKKGMFGGSKGSQTFPISQIKVYNGRAQALAKGLGGAEVLEVFFLHGVEEFKFVGGGKKKIQNWIAKINEAVTGEVAPEVATSSLPGADRVVEVLKDTLGAFKSLRGGKAESPAPATVSTKCVSCGAPVSGLQGQRITCPYCNAAQQL